MYFFFVNLFTLLRSIWIRYTKPRHKRYYKQAKNVLKKLSTIEHPGAKLNYLKKINPYVFEELVLLLFAKNGFAIWISKSYSADGGFDGKVFHPKIGWCPIQSKCYTQRIASSHVKEFANQCKKYPIGFFVHTARSSDQLRLFVQKQPCAFISGSVLIDSISANETDKFLLNYSFKCIKKRSIP